jgi:hypothetical protein
MPRMQQRRDTAANWTGANPVLASGELGLETDTGKFKIGNGTSVWSSLPYVGVVSSVNGETGNVVLDATSVSAVASVNALSGTISISAGDNITVSTAGSSITISAAPGGVVSVNGATGAVSLTTADLTAVSSVNQLSGTITIAAGDNVTVSTAGSTITIQAGGGGGAVDSVNGSTGTIVLSAADVTAASSTHASQHQTGGSDVLLPIVTAVSITASVNDYSLPVGDIFRISQTSTNTLNITGLATAVDGAARLLVNVSTGASSSFTLKHADTNSTAVSRLLVPWAGDYVLSPNGGAALVIYDNTDSRWRVV